MCIAMRAGEAIRSFICYPELEVKILLSHGGITAASVMSSRTTSLKLLCELFHAGAGPYSLPEQSPACRSCRKGGRIPKHSIITGFLGQTRDRFHTYNEEQDLDGKLATVTQIPGYDDYVTSDTRPTRWGVMRMFEINARLTEKIWKLLDRVGMDGHRAPAHTPPHDP